MADAVKINLLAEILLGVDPTTTSLVTTDIGAYWMLDEVGTLTETGYDGSISGDLWKTTGAGTSIEVNQSGTTSDYWEIEPVTGSLIVLGT